MTAPQESTAEILLEVEGPAERVLYALGLLGGVGVLLFPLTHLALGGSVGGGVLAALIAVVLSRGALALLERVRTELVLRPEERELWMVTRYPWRSGGARVGRLEGAEDVELVAEEDGERTLHRLRLLRGDEPLYLTPWIPASPGEVEPPALRAAARLAEETGGARRVVSGRREAGEHGAALLRFGALLVALPALAFLISRVLSRLGW